MALGILFIYLTPGYAPDLMSYLFGSILTVTRDQILLSALLCAAVVAFFARCHRPLFYIAFDKEYSRTHNVRINVIDTAATLFIALSIVLCLKLAGIILVISYLTIPQSIAGLFYKNFSQLLVASSLISALGSIGGLFLSASLQTPVGATMVVTFLLLFLAGWLLRKCLRLNRGGSGKS
jgi:zinc transport system permease protein